jgi:peptidoglycan/xylan/chitin deacetylase (PgdA/CDA1 family)
MPSAVKLGEEPQEKTWRLGLFGVSIPATHAHKGLRCLYLLYHELRPSHGKYSYSLETSAFATHADVIAEILGTDQPEILAAVTFDDGYASDSEYALPILSARGLRAHFFITVGRTGKTSGYMGWPQVRALTDAGHIVGTHGWSHALLTHCSAKELDRELNASRKLLEDKLGIAVTTMSLPGGRYNRRVLLACQEAGYTRVYTSEPRLETTVSGLTIGRVNVSSDRSVSWVRALLQPQSRELSKLQRQYSMKKATKVFLGDWAYEKLWAAVTRQGTESQVQPSTAHEDPASNQ